MENSSPKTCTSQRVIDRSRDVTALDEMDKPAVRPEVSAIIDQDIADHGELWKELVKK